jgi:protein ImuB
MSIAQAGEMLQGSASPTQQSSLSAAEIQPHDLQLDKESLEQIASLFQQRISPLVAIEALDDKPWAGHPRHQSESLLCDISGVAHLFGGEIGLLEAADRLLKATGLSGRMAIADSVGAAWALSHYSRESSISLREIAAGISDFAERNTTLGLQQSIKSLPVESLRISPAVAATLSRLGIERVDQLLRLPRSGLAARLGNPLVRRISQIIGEVDEPLGVHRVAAEHSQTLALEYPTSDQRILADRIERLTQKVRAGLATCQRGALRMTCRLDFSAHPPLTLDIGLFAPTIDADHLSGLMINRLETKRLPACVERLTILVTLSGPLRTAQKPLFDYQSNDADSSTIRMSGSSIGRQIDSFSGRLGRDAVVGVKIEDDPLPEKAFTVSSLTGVSPGKFFSPHVVGAQKAANSSTRSRENTSAEHSWRKYSREPSPDDAMRRPLSLLAEPVPLAVALTLENGPFCWHATSPKLPSRLRLNGEIHLVVAHWGPERIETGWWKGPSIRRDYYRIETDQGRWWWIFRNLISRTETAETKRYRWMLHGRFA